MIMPAPKTDPKQLLEDAARDALARLLPLLEWATRGLHWCAFTDAEKFLFKDAADRLSALIQRQVDEYAAIVDGTEYLQWCKRMCAVAGSYEDCIPF